MPAQATTQALLAASGGRFAAVDLAALPAAVFRMTPPSPEDLRTVAPPLTPARSNPAPRQPVPCEPAKKPADPLAAGRAELRRFTAAFGPDGATWFAEGRSYDQSQALHASKRQSRPTPTGLADKIGANVARFAAGIRLPAAN
jgi:hypothetical protein